LAVLTVGSKALAFVSFEGEAVIYEKNLLVNPPIPKLIYIILGGRQWVSYAKKNGLKRHTLYSQPYASKCQLPITNQNTD